MKSVIRYKYSKSDDDDSKEEYLILDLRNLEKQLDKKQKEVDSLKYSLFASKTENAFLKSDIDDLKEKVNKLKEYNEQLNEDLWETKDAKSELEEELGNLKFEKCEMRRTLKQFLRENF